MFGGLTFMVCGHMCCGVMRESLVVRVGPETARIALTRPQVTPFDVTGKPMTGMVLVGSPGIKTDASLSSWVQEAVDFVSSLPARNRRPDVKKTEADAQAGTQGDEAPSQSTDRLARLLSAIPVTIYTADSVGEFRASFVSDHLRTLLGYEPEEFTCT